MINKIKNLVSSVLFISKVTDIRYKKLRVVFSGIVSNLIVAIDILIILLFTQLISNEISVQNVFLVSLLNYILEIKILFPLLIVIRFLVLVIEKLNSEHLSISVSKNLRSQVLKLAYERGDFSIADSYYYLNQVSINVSGFYKNFIIFLTNVVQIVGFLLFLVLLESQVVLYLIIGILIIFLPTKYLIKKGKHYQHVSYEENKNLSGLIQRIIENTFLIKVLETDDYEFQNFEKSLQKYRNSQFLNIVYGTINSIFPIFTTLLFLAFVISYMEVDFISLEFLGILLRLFTSLSGFNNGLNLVLNSSVHVKALSDLFTKSKLRDRSKYSVNTNLENSVEINNLDFKFFNSDDNIYSKISLNIPKNKHTVITGKNGSGKSTLLGLILGVYLPTKGSIDVSTKKIGYVGVNPLIIDGTLKFNLLYGNDHKITDEEINILISQFNLFDKKSLSLNDKVSNKTLSSGQMQKIAIIRALLNKCNILILDEATANLDQSSQTLLFDILKGLNITIINSSHSIENFSYDFELNIELVNDSRVIHFRTNE